ncbi:MAG TPA: tetratricopeptide repeat protein [Gemmatimonadales bacterium]|nr:tetratricopeptide repeat protein [Gemmatimonadales bacterium]
MAYTSEIEKLEARYRENPKGRNFAPLADAYRKAGLIDNAIELCQSGLQLHPDYVSGHIVHGRCLVDKKDDTGAEAVFRKVLDLDPENILALKVLAEISERNERFGAASEWLNRLLLADPMNGEAADGLSRVRGKAAAQPPPPEPAPPEPAPVELPLPELALEPEPVTVEEPVAALLEVSDEAEPPAPAPDTSLVVEHEELELKPADAAAQRRLSIEYMEGPFDVGISEGPTAAMEKPEFELERTSEPPAEAAVQPFDGVDFDQVADVGPVEGIVLEEEPALTPDPEIQVEGLARTQYEGSGMFRLDNQPPPAAAEPPEERATSPVADLPLIMPEEVDSPPAPWPEAARPSRETEPLEAPLVPAAAAAPLPLRLPDDDGAADTAALSQAEPVVTETMAELYLRQGHREEALQVYQALSSQRPDDARLRRKVAELSAPPSRGRTSGSGQTAGAFLKGILSARPGAPAPVLAAEPPPADQPPSPSSDEIGGQANGPAERVELEAPAPGTPTRPASDTISLDSVFGEEGGRGSVPASPDAAPEQPAKLPVASGGFSFDDFFGAATVPAAGGAGKAPGSRPSRPSGRNRSPEQEEDLDQFQAWLKSLKA